MLQRDCGDRSRILLWGVGGEAVEATLVETAHHVKDGPGSGIESFGRTAFWREFSGVVCVFQYRQERVMTGAEEFIGLAAMPLLAANGDEQTIEGLLLAPECHPD